MLVSGTWMPHSKVLPGHPVSKAFEVQRQGQSLILALQSKQTSDIQSAKALDSSSFKDSFHSTCDEATLCCYWFPVRSPIHPYCLPTRALQVYLSFHGHCSSVNTSLNHVQFGASQHVSTISIVCCQLPAYCRPSCHRRWTPNQGSEVIHLLLLLSQPATGERGMKLNSACQAQLSSKTAM